MMAKLASYPFEERARQLSEMSSSKSPIDDHLTTPHASIRLKTLLGWLNSGASDDVKRDIDAIIREGRTKSAAPPAHQTPASDITASPVSHSEAQDHCVTDDGLNLHTSALDRYCDRKGLAVEWPTTEVPAARAQFRCVARVDGREFVGEGKNMKVAKHRASRKACIAFGIDI